MGCGTMMDGMGMMMGWGFVGLLLTLLLIVLFVVAVVVALWWMWGHYDSGRDNALDVLKKRYAGGEISKEEFERIKEDLK